MTVAGLPLESWLLIVASVGIGLAVEIAFFAAHRRAERGGRPGRRPRHPRREADRPAGPGA